MSKWTTEPPMGGGWYWWRTDGISPKVMHVTVTGTETWGATAGQSYGRILDGEWWPNRLRVPVQDRHAQKEQK